MKISRCVFALLAVLVCASCVVAHADSAWDEDRVWSTRADLDGDGRLEKIALHAYHKEGSQWTGDGRFRLSVNGQTLFDDLHNCDYLCGLRLADVDRADRYKEIVVDGNIVEWVQSAIYRFSGGKLHRVGQVGINPHFYGDGRISASGGDDHDLSLKLHYRVAHGKLVFMPQKIYQLEATKRIAFQRLPLFQRRNDAEPFAYVQPQHFFQPLQTDKKGWYRVRYGWGHTAWIHKKQFDYPRSSPSPTAG